MLVDEKSLPISEENKLIANPNKRASSDKNKRWIYLISIILVSCYVILAKFPGSCRHHGTSEIHRFDRNNKLHKIHPYTATDAKAFGGNADTSPEKKHLVIAQKAAVASDVPLCSTMAKDILLQGGCAIDAAITTALCIGSINSHSSGIGGGGYMTLRHSNGTMSTINMREMAPRVSHKTMYDGKEYLSKFGGLAVAVPGEIAGLQLAYERHSTKNLTWSQLFEPVIELNRKGFEVSEVLAAAIELATPAFYLEREGWEWLFVQDGQGGTRLAKKGDWIKRDKYAETLELISKEGASIFYDAEGPIVSALVDTIKRTGGVVEKDDFANYTAFEMEPLIIDYMDRKVVTVRNPASGPALALGLHIMSNYTGLDGRLEKDFGTDETQLMVETMKWMAAARTELGDYVEGNPRVAEVVTEEWASKCVANISLNTTHPWKDYNPSYEQSESHGTAHISVIDEDGMAVSFTTTVNLLFGSLICDPKTGIVLNDEMDDFSVPKTDNAFELRPSIYNYVVPYRRPLSSTVPSIIYTDEGGVELIIGAAGGSRISSSVFQAIVRIFQYNEPLLNAIAFPRLHHQLLPETAYLEFGAPEEIMSALEKKGHQTEYQIPATAMNAIYRDRKTGVIHAVSDWWRKRGRADGY